MSPDTTYVVIINLLHAIEITIDMNEGDIEKKVISQAIDKFNAKENEIKKDVADYESEKVWDIRIVTKI